MSTWRCEVVVFKKKRHWIRLFKAALLLEFTSMMKDAAWLHCHLAQRSIGPYVPSVCHTVLVAALGFITQSRLSLRLLILCATGHKDLKDDCPDCDLYGIIQRDCFLYLVWVISCLSWLRNCKFSIHVVLSINVIYCWNGTKCKIYNISSA